MDGRGGHWPEIQRQLRCVAGAVQGQVRWHGAGDHGKLVKDRFPAAEVQSGETRDSPARRRLAPPPRRAVAGAGPEELLDGLGDLVIQVKSALLGCTVDLEQMADTPQD